MGDLLFCGDLAYIKEFDEKCLLALIDVLGHGSEAREVALLAEKCLIGCHEDRPIQIINKLHDCLRGSRGAVVSICEFSKVSGLLTHVGIGNITVRIIGSKPMRLVSRDGIVGYGTISPKEKEILISPGDMVMMHSDGIKEHFDILECSGLFMEDAPTIVKGMMEKFALKNDDASCVILKYLK